MTGVRNLFTLQYRNHNPNTRFLLRYIIFPADENFPRTEGLISGLRDRKGVWRQNCKCLTPILRIWLRHRNRAIYACQCQLKKRPDGNFELLDDTLPYFE